MLIDGVGHWNVWFRGPSSGRCPNTMTPTMRPPSLCGTARGRLPAQAESLEGQGERSYSQLIHRPLGVDWFGEFTPFRNSLIILRPRSGKSEPGIPQLGSLETPFDSRSHCVSCGSTFHLSLSSSSSFERNGELNPHQSTPPICVAAKPLVCTAALGNHSQTKRNGRKSATSSVPRWASRCL